MGTLLILRERTMVRSRIVVHVVYNETEIVTKVYLLKTKHPSNKEYISGRVKKISRQKSHYHCFYTEDLGLMFLELTSSPVVDLRLLGSGINMVPSRRVLDRRVRRPYDSVSIRPLYILRRLPTKTVFLRDCHNDF